MILITLGTQDKQFTRLLDMVQKEINKGNIKDKVVVQAGHTKYESKYMEIFDLIDREKFSARVTEELRKNNLIEKYEIEPHDLIFEITETTFIHNIEAVNAMIRFFHDKNIRISMDDFGSGYSSLNTLKDILFDEVKIDKRFLSDDLSENGKIVLQEIFHLLKRTNKFIVCEGVETKEMVDFLVEEGCDELQGYYYYKPMSQESFEQLLQKTF